VKKEERCEKKDGQVLFGFSPASFLLTSFFFLRSQTTDDKFMTTDQLTDLRARVEALRGYL